MIDELEVRQAAMAYIATLAEAAGGVVTRHELEAFTFHGERLPLIDQSRGIRNRAALATKYAAFRS